MLLHRQFAKRILLVLSVHHKHEFPLVVVDFVPQMTKHRLFVRFGKFLYQTAGTVAQTLAKVTHVFLDVMHGKIENADAYAAVQQRFPVGSFLKKKTVVGEGRLIPRHYKSVYKCACTADHRVGKIIFLQSVYQNIARVVDSRHACIGNDGNVLLLLTKGQHKIQTLFFVEFVVTVQRLGNLIVVKQYLRMTGVFAENCRNAF